MDADGGGDVTAGKPSDGILDALFLNLPRLALVLGPRGACCGLFSIVLCLDIVL